MDTKDTRRSVLKRGAGIAAKTVTIGGLAVTVAPNHPLESMIKAFHGREGTSPVQGTKVLYEPGAAWGNGSWQHTPDQDGLATRTLVFLRDAAQAAAGSFLDAEGAAAASCDCGSMTVVSYVCEYYSGVGYTGRRQNQIRSHYSPNCSGTCYYWQSPYCDPGGCCSYGRAWCGGYC